MAEMTGPNIPSRAIAAEEAAMKGENGSENRREIDTVDGRIVILLNRFDLGQGLRIQWKFDSLGGFRFKQLPQLIKLLNRLGRIASDHRTSVGRPLDQPDPVQLHQRLPNQMPRGPKPIDQFIFDQSFARMKLPKDDVFLQSGDDRVKHGWTHRRQGNRPARL